MKYRLPGTRHDDRRHWMVTRGFPWRNAKSVRLLAIREFTSVYLVRPHRRRPYFVVAWHQGLGFKITYTNPLELQR